MKNYIWILIGVIVLAAVVLVWKHPVPAPSQDSAYAADEGASNDTGEGAGAAQDVSVAVAANIVGKWQSKDDPKFVREFNADGTATDYYGDEVQSNGTWKAYSSVTPLPVPFPLEPNAGYIQMLMNGDEATSLTLNFKVSALTPESLELVYMERGGALDFTAIK